MVPHIRNILGGFLFSGDDIDKPVRVLSGGERTRLAVARMLLRPSNTLLLDEPTNHLDLDSKDVLLEALEDFGGTLIFVSHDRYFVDKLATKVIEIGGGEALVYPGNYEEFLWSRKAARGRAATDQTATAARCPTRSQAPEADADAAAVKAAPQAGSPPRPVRAEREGAGGHGALRRSQEAGSDDAARREKKSRPDSGAIAGARRPDCRTRAGDQGDRAHDGGPGVLREPRRRQADHRPAPSPDVGGRRSDAPVGGLQRTEV